MNKHDIGNIKSFYQELKLDIRAGHYDNYFRVAVVVTAVGFISLGAGVLLNG